MEFTKATIPCIITQHYHNGTLLTVSLKGSLILSVGIEQHIWYDSNGYKIPCSISKVENEQLLTLIIN